MRGGLYTERDRRAPRARLVTGRPPVTLPGDDLDAMQNNPLIRRAGIFCAACASSSLPGIRAYVVVPLLVNILLFSALIYFGAAQFRELAGLVAAGLARVARFLLLPLFVLVTLIVVFFTFSLVGNLMAAPFNGLLAEAVECQITGAPIPAGGWKQMMLDLGRTLVSELRKLGYIVLWGIPVLLSCS